MRSILVAIFSHTYNMTKRWRFLKIGKNKVKIDSEDFDRVSRHKWRIRTRKDTSKLTIITSVHTSKGARNISLGHFIMNPPKGKVVYPRRYFEGFDFRKDNLIVCTIQERQTMLPKKRSQASSNYRGVSYSKKNKRWRASITVKGRSINLGDYSTEASAALAYNQASKRYFGDLGYQNTITRKSNRRSS
ncbi:MAG: hypothetical protein IT289_07540 [Oligoflexia bacterium]|nr:hypothetical protein [Oligoflexia bacterium]